jgi:hypothetical protein
VVAVVSRSAELHGQAVALDVERRELAFKGTESHGAAAFVLQALANIQTNSSGSGESE